MRRGLLALVVCGVALAAGADPAADLPPAGGDGEAYVDPCLAPEELAVLDRVASRDRELAQREELVLLQEQALAERERQLDARIEQLDALRADIERLLRQRADARGDGAEALVAMVDQMKARDAAAMLTEMDPVLAAAVLERLASRQAGRVLGAMDPDVAAELGASLAIDPVQIPTPHQETE